MTTEISPKNPFKFRCDICLYNTCNQKDFNKHLQTKKHTNNISNATDNSIIPNKYLCPNCDKKFNDRSGLWRHNKKCIPISVNTNEEKEQTTDKDQLIMMLIKENSDFKSMLIEQQSMSNTTLGLMMKVIENGTTNNSNNTTNSHNKAFNLQFFLNDTCKDAMNIADFVDSIKLQLSDLEKVGELGYVEGISNIIIKNLNSLDETKRPVHCTDKKRETIYIKDEGQWEKEDDNNSRLKKSINKVANKNIKLISQFREKYPECRKSESSISDKYNKMIIEAMGGLGDNTAEKEEKIIRNISKATIISSRNTK
jgi:hypothetical protein